MLYPILYTFSPGGLPEEWASLNGVFGEPSTIHLNEYEVKTFDFSLYLLSQQETRNMVEFEYKQEGNDYEKTNNVFVDEIIRNIELEKND